MDTNAPAPVSPPAPSPRSIQELTLLLLASWIPLAMAQRFLLLGRIPVPTVRILGEGALQLKGRMLFFTVVNGLATDLVMFTVLAGPFLFLLWLLRHRVSDRAWRALSILPWVPVGILANILFLNWVSFLKTDHALSFMLLAVFMSSPGQIVGFLAREAGGLHKLVVFLLGIGVVPALIGALWVIVLKRLPSFRVHLQSGIRGRIVLLLLALQGVYVVRAAVGTRIDSIRGRWIYTVIREYEDPTWRLVTGAIWAMTSPTIPRDLKPAEMQALRPVITPWDVDSPALDPRFPLYRKIALSGPRSPDIPVPDDKPNIALVLLESTGTADVGVFGDEGNVTPCLDKLAKEGLLFRRHVTTASDSVGAVFSLLSSAYPELSAGRDGVFAMKGTLSDVLTQAGYTTSFTAVRATGWHTISEYTRGMHVQHTEQLARSWGDDKEIFDKSLEWIDQTQEPWLATVFTASHHSPWVIPGQDFTGENTWDAARQTLTYQDTQLCRFVDELRKREKKSKRKTLLVAVGDHGNHIPKVGKKIHIGGLREDTLHVPLVFHAPGWIEPAESEVLGNHVDLMPTILDVAGVHTFESAAIGNSLLRGGQQRAFVINAAGAGFLGLLRADRKLVMDNFTGEAIPYRIFSDEPVPDERPENVHALQQEVLAMHKLSSWLMISRRLAPRLPDSETKTEPGQENVRLLAPAKDF